MASDGAEMMVFIDSDCDEDPDMQAVMRKIQNRLKRVMKKETQASSPVAKSLATPSGSVTPSARVRTRKLNARLKRLLAAKDNHKTTVTPAQGHSQQQADADTTSNSCDSTDSGMSEYISRWAKLSCGQCGNSQAASKRNKKKRKPVKPTNEETDVPSKKFKLMEESQPQKRKTFDKSDYVAMDCEFVGVGRKKHSALGRCSVVDFDGNVVIDIYAQPEEPITDYRTRWSGLRKRDFVNAVPVENAVNVIRRVLKGKVVVGHAVHNDFHVLGIRHPPDMVRDTQFSARLCAMAESRGYKQNRVSLKMLSKILLDRSIQGGEHCSVEDSRATMDLFKLIHTEWEQALTQLPPGHRGREKPAKQAQSAPVQGNPNTAGKQARDPANGEAGGPPKKAKLLEASPPHRRRTFTKTDYVALDCEFVGVVGKKKLLSALGRCSVVDYDGNVVLDIRTRPDQPIRDYMTPWSGLRKEDFVNALPFDNAVNMIRRVLQGKVVVGHAVHNDFRVMGIEHPADMIRDTQASPLLRSMAASQGATGVSLKTFSEALLGHDIQVGEHCSVEDARTAMNLFKLVHTEWEQALSQQPSGLAWEQSTLTPEPFSPAVNTKHLMSARKGPVRTNSRDSAASWESLRDSYLDDVYWRDVEKEHYCNLVL